MTEIKPRKIVAIIGIVFAVICITVSIAAPSSSTNRGPWTQEQAAIATLRSIYAAQQACHASRGIDIDGDGVGEYGYFAELSGAVAARGSSEPMHPPALASDYAKVSSRPGIDGGGVERSGYLFRMFLPAEDGRGIPEAAKGGASGTGPDPDLAEKYWCCYAWPIRANAHINRTFFINQTGDVIAARDDEPRYVGTDRVPRDTAAFRRRDRRGIAGELAGDALGRDSGLWLWVQ